MYLSRINITQKALCTFGDKCMKITISCYLLLIGAIVGFSTSLISCSDKEQAVTDLKSVEISEYQGENLSSIDDFYLNDIAGTQYIDIDQYHLLVTGLVEKPLEYTYDEVINGYQNYEKVVTLNCVEGWRVNILWEGFMVRDLIADAKPLPEVTTIILKAYEAHYRLYLIFC